MYFCSEHVFGIPVNLFFVHHYSVQHWTIIKKELGALGCRFDHYTFDKEWHRSITSIIFVKYRKNGIIFPWKRAAYNYYICTPWVNRISSCLFILLVYITTTTKTVHLLVCKQSNAFDEKLRYNIINHF